MDSTSHTPALLPSQSSQSPIHNKKETPGSWNVYSRGRKGKKQKGILSTYMKLMEGDTDDCAQQQHKITPKKNPMPLNRFAIPITVKPMHNSIQFQKGEGPSKSMADNQNHLQQAKQQWEMAQEMGMTGDMGHATIIERICDMEIRDSKEAEKLGNRNDVS